MNKQTVKAFNNPDSLLVVTLYPKQGELYSEGTSGVAMYTKNIVSRMKQRVIVLANIYDKKRVYQEDNALIVRCFSTTTLFMWLQILKTLNDYSQVRKVLVQFDFAIYNNLYNSALVLPFLLYLKFRGYNIAVVNHHIVIDIRKLAGHVGLTKSRMDVMRALILNAFFRLFYIALGLIADNIIVLEETLKQTLAAIIPAKKIAVVPIGVDTNLKAHTKEDARKALEIPRDALVVLYFGFLNWFKGADFFASTFADQKTLLGKPVHAILAGGASPTQGKKAHYKKYYEDILKTVNGSGTTTITGYVPQENIVSYFSAADVVVLPYRHYMTASGVLSLVFSYKTPFVVSEDLLEMMQSTDMRESMKLAKLTHDDVAFSLDAESCIKAISHAVRPATKEKIEKFTQLMQEKRDYQESAYLYEELFSERSGATKPVLEPALAEA